LKKINPTNLKYGANTGRVFSALKPGLESSKGMFGVFFKTENQ
jgi:hypothetical protein